jgi:replication factor C small subunit
MENMQSKWVDTFIPKTVDDLILNPISKEKLKRLLESGKRFNVTLHGRPGIGKTATSNVISKTLDAIEYFVPCSVSGNVDTMKTKVTQFCESVSFDGRPKLVILDEIDGMSIEAQKSLRNIMDSHKDTIFLLTCNYLNRVLEPIQDRCPPVSLTCTVADITPRLVHIMETENIKYTEEDLAIFTKTIVPKFLPSIRSVVAVLQDCCYTGELDPNTEVELIDGLDKTCKYIFAELKAGVNPKTIREYLINNSEAFDEDYLKLASNLFNMLCKTSVSPDVLSKIAEIIYRIDQVIDKEIQFYVLVNYISNLIKIKNAN